MIPAQPDDNRTPKQRVDAALRAFMQAPKAAVDASIAQEKQARQEKKRKAG